MAKTSTKRAMLGSAISLLLCFAMLIGATFAWFTDNVASTNNIIKSGNLDVELYYQVEGQTDWTKVTETTNIFKENALWEPGYTEVVKLKVVNEGSLALKYQLGVNVASEIGSKNVDGKDFKLSDYIKYGIVEGAQSYTRDTAIAAVDTTAALLKKPYTSESTKLLAKNDADTDEKVVTMVVYMPTSVGNEANYAKGENAPVINLGINLFATQVEEEKDSFGNDYDAGATYKKETPVAKTQIITKTMTIKNPEGKEILGEKLAIDTRNSSMGLRFDDIVSLDTAYQFEPTLSAEEVKLSEYKDWHADFVVSVDKDIPANSIALAGYYDAWCSINNDNWVALTNDGFEVDSNTEIRLVETMGGGNISVSLQDLSNYGNDGIGFLCGAMKLSDEIIGTTLKVELRLYEVVGGSSGSETGEYMSIGTFKYTFK